MGDNYYVVFGIYKEVEKFENFSINLFYIGIEDEVGYFLFFGILGV